MAESHHVRFASDTQLDPEPIRLARAEEDRSRPPEAHVGILRNHHTYSVDIPIPHSLGAEVSARHAPSNTAFTVLEPPVTVKSEAGVDEYVSTVKLQVKTVTDSSIAETMELFVNDGGESMEVLLTAKVIQCNQGIPLLKEGVHIISQQHLEDCTEWQGSYEENRVHFASGTHLDPEPIRLDSTNFPPEAYVGILRNHHTYSIDIPIPHSLGPEVSAHHAQTNVCFTVTEPPVTAKSETGYVSTVKLQVKTVTDSNIAETMELFVNDGRESSSSMEVLLTAKVIWCNLDIPLLKEGVHVLANHHHSEDCTAKEWPGSYEENRVRFASGTHLDPAPIRLSRDDSTSLPPEAHVGILRTHHTYSVDIPIPHSLGPEVSARHAQTNVCVTVAKPPVTAESGTGTDKYATTVKVHVKAVREGSIAETIELFVVDGGESSSSMEVLLTAKVIRCDQGTPLLKEGVRVLSHQHSDECTEWPGSHKEESHVRFASGTHLDPEPIRLEREDSTSLPPEAHVGILRNHHTYSVDIPIPHSLGAEVSARHAPSNTAFTVMEPPVTVKSEAGVDEYVSTVKLQVKTVTDGNIAETMELFVVDGGESSSSMEVLLTAKVIRCNQGTPLLKEGVCVLSHQHSEECTEWPGSHKEETHVRFASGTHLDPEPIHLVRVEEDPSLPPEAHVGMLRSHHTYSIDIPIPHSLGPEVSARHAQTNVCFTVTEPPVTVERETGTNKYTSTIKLQVKTVKEGSIAEKMDIFVGEGDGGRMEVALTAKVIKNNQGTPLLKDGVRVLSRQHSEDSDFTEWPGFSKETEEEMEN